MQVSIPLPSLELIELSAENEGKPGSTATIVQDLGDGRSSEHEGRVLRLLNELDAQTRMAQVLIVVEDPLDPGENQLPLLPGAFVSVELVGKQLERVSPVPRRAVFDGNRVWVVTDESTLESRALNMVWSDADRLWVQKGLEDGARLVTSRVEGIEGMPVRTREAAPTTAEETK